MRANFINVDLEVYSTASLVKLTEIAEAVGLICLYNGRDESSGYLATFELINDQPNVNESIIGIINAIHLDVRFLSILKQSSKKVLDIGYESNSLSNQNMAIIDTKALAQATKIGASISFSIYESA